MPEPISLTNYDSVEPFIARIRPALEANEAKNGLILGMAARLQQDPHYYGEADPYFATVETEREAVAAIMTPPHGLALFYEHESSCTAEVLGLIADNLHTGRWNVPTVHASSSASTLFAEIWNDLTGSNSEVEFQMRLFELRQLADLRYSPGQLRLATNNDFDQFAEWLYAFEQDAIRHPEDREAIQKTAKRRIENRSIYFWETAQASGGATPVCFVGTARPTARGIAIGPVYTPPEFRARGYATSAVAHVSQKMLNQGKEFCTLFTDLANPTSNHIYQSIGYRPINDLTVHRFHGATKGGELADQADNCGEE